MKFQARSDERTPTFGTLPRQDTNGTLEAELAELRDDHQNYEEELLELREQCEVELPQQIRELTAAKRRAENRNLELISRLGDTLTATIEGEGGGDEMVGAGGGMSIRRSATWTGNGELDLSAHDDAEEGAARGER